MSDVFISYSRKDKEFVHKLNDTLKARDRESWVDWEKIRTAEDWWRKIQEAIAAANTFVFVITPDSIASDICRKEVDYASSLNKRIMPILRRELTKDLLSTMNHDHALRAYNWLYFQESDDFDEAFGNLLLAIDSDYAHADAHTRLLLKAIEWDGKLRKDGFLLKDDGLKEAEQWLAESESKEPKPTELQVTFIENSRKVEDANLQAIQILKDAKEKAARQVKFGSAVLGVTLLLSVVAGILTAKSMNDANEYAKLVIDKSIDGVEQLSQNNQQLEALTESIKTLDLMRVLNQKNNQSNFDRLYAVISKIQEQNRLQGHNDKVLGVSINHDGKLIVSAGMDKTILLWNVDGKLLDRSIQQTDSISSISFSRHHKNELVSTSADGIVKLWVVGNDNKLSVKAQFTEKISGEVNDAKFNSDNTIIALASEDGTVRLWDLYKTSKREQLDLVNAKNFSKNSDKIKGYGVYSLDFNSKSDIIAYGYEEGGVYIWNWKNKTKPYLIGQHNVLVSQIKYSLDGKILASASNDGVIKLWDVSNNYKLIGIIKAHEKFIYGLSFDKDNSFIASSSMDVSDSLKIWSIEKAKNSHLKDEILKQSETSLLGHKDRVNTIQFNPSNKYMLVSSSNDKTIRLWHWNNIINSQSSSLDDLLAQSCIYSKSYLLFGVRNNLGMKVLDTCYNYIGR